MSHVSNPLSLKFDKKRHRVKHCPCGKSNRDGKFVPYVGYDTKDYCHSCGQVYLPEKNVIASAARQSPKYQQIASPAKSGFAMTILIEGLSRRLSAAKAPTQACHCEEVRRSNLLH